MDESLPLHRKYRSTSLVEYVGNAELKQSVLKALASPVIPQIIMLYGHAGCGKTSMARLIAKEISCEHRDVNTGACGVCDSCKSITEYIRDGDTGALTNIEEIDVGQLNTKDQIAGVLTRASMPSMFGEWKVFILDECHNMSVTAQTLLLKTFEEPPEHVMFILCTTDPDKVKDTIRSRCQYKWEVKKPTGDELICHLSDICGKEGVESNKRGLGLISSTSGYVPRDSLNLLERVIREKGDANYKSVADVTQTIVNTTYVTFYDNLLRHKDIFAYIKQIVNIKKTTGLKPFMNGLLNYTVKGIYLSNGVMPDGAAATEEIDIKNAKLFSTLDGKYVVWLLNQLISFQHCEDSELEAKLLYMGYYVVSGMLEKPNASVTDKGNTAAVSVIKGAAPVSAETAASHNSYADKFKPTEKDIDTMVSSAYKGVSGTGIAELFNGACVKLPDDKK